MIVSGSLVHLSLNRWFTRSVHSNESPVHLVNDRQLTHGNGRDGGPQPVFPSPKSRTSVGAAAPPARLFCLSLKNGGRAADSPCMDAAERYEVLSRYAEHIRRFEELCARHGRPLDPSPGAEVVPVQRYRELDHEPTNREIEVLGLIAEGLTAGEIGSRLHLSEETVRSHVRGLFAALRVNSRAKAVAVGFRRGMIA
jgi:DNA-binding CsgD family transcriptional regulator